MAYKFEKAQAFMEALTVSPQRNDLPTPTLELSIPPTVTLSTIAPLVYQGFGDFAQIISQKIPVLLQGETLNTKHHYGTPGGKMVVFSLKSTDTPEQLSSQAISAPSILELYHSVELSGSELTKIVIEERITESNPISNPIIEASIKSHFETPLHIVSAIPDSERVIARLPNNPQQLYTTLRLRLKPSENAEEFSDRICKALETTEPGIITYIQSQTRHVRRELIAA